MQEKRTKMWIDRFQTLLFCRIAFYFVFYQLAVWFLVVIERHIWTGIGQILGEATAVNFMIFLIGVVLVVGALFTYDAVRFAHRIVGPLVRFRKAIQAIRDGEEVSLVQLRKGDMLQEMKEEFNDMLHALEERGAVALTAPEGHLSDASSAEPAMKS